MRSLFGAAAPPFIKSMNFTKDFLLELYQLKALPRTGWVRAQVSNPETVASHSFGVACLALLLCPPGLSRERALQLALVHDWAEARVGDITPHDPVTPREKHERECGALRQMVASLPQGEALFDLFMEYEAGETAEAKFVRALDKLDMGLQAQAYGGAGLEEFTASAKAALGGFPDLLSLLS